MLSIFKGITCLLSLLLLLVGCADEKRVKSGTIVYSVDYPRQKENAFLYGILPKEVEVNFQNGMVRNNISHANLQNILLMDCNQKEMGIFFQYGEEAFLVKMTDSDIKQMLRDQQKYTIQLVNETKQILGFEAKKARAINKRDSKDVLTIWYTEEIDLNHPNWYNTFEEIPGVLLAYSVERYGIRMDYKAIEFIADTTVTRSNTLDLPAKGTPISYAEYNKKMSSLFVTFD